MKVPLGWDIVQAQTDPNARKYLPELGGSYQGTASGVIGGAVAETVAEESTVYKFGRQILLAVVVGSLTAVGTEVLLDFIRGSDLYKAVISERKQKKKEPNMITNVKNKNKGLSTQNKVLLGLVVLGAGLTQAPKNVRQKVVYGIVGYGVYVGYN